MRDSHLSQACVCVCNTDLGPLWDTKKGTWHVAKRGQRWQTQTSRCTKDMRMRRRDGDGRAELMKSIGNGENCGARRRGRGGIGLMDGLMSRDRGDVEQRGNR